jgi:hypothetical protein
MNLNERIREIINIKCSGNESEFTRQTKLSTGFLSKIKNTAQPKTINKILDSYPDIDKFWLLTGEGEMFLDTQFSIVEKSNPNYHATQQKLPKSHSMETQDYQDYDELKNKIRELEKQIELYLSLLKAKDETIELLKKQNDENNKNKDEIIELLREQKEVLKQRNECYSIVEKKGASQG